jgi:hypothetical protein
MLPWLGGLSGCGDRTGLLIPGLDALPPVSVPPAAPPPSACADGGSTLIYLISDGFKLLSYDPPSGALTQIGQITCPETGTCASPNGTVVPASPFSMAVDQTGIAYVVYCDGELFRVSTANAACEATTFLSQQHDFSPKFGMGFAQNAQGAGETLYVAGDLDTNAGEPLPSVLASVDTTSLVLSVIGTFGPQLLRPELTGTGAGGLFAFAELYAADDVDEGSSIIAQIDPATAQVTRVSPLPGVVQGGAWAFAFWGGDFYTFTAPSSATVVQRFSPSDGTVTTVGDVPTDFGLIVGAGVSTCAPQTLPQGVTLPR